MCVFACEEGVFVPLQLQFASLRLLFQYSQNRCAYLLTIPMTHRTHKANEMLCCISAKTVKNFDRLDELRSLFVAKAIFDYCLHPDRMGFISIICLCL